MGWPSQSGLQIQCDQYPYTYGQTSVFQPQLLTRYLKHLQEVLTKCKYLKWTFDKVLQKQEDRRTENKRGQSRNTNHIVVPYSQGLCASYKTVHNKYGVQVHFKGGNTLKNLLMFPKDKEKITTQSNVTYLFECDKTECDKEYIGESARTFEEHYKEHLKVPSPIFDHQNTIGHITTVENFQDYRQEGAE